MLYSASLHPSSSCLPSTRRRWFMIGIRSLTKIWALTFWVRSESFTSSVIVLPYIILTKIWIVPVWERVATRWAVALAAARCLAARVVVLSPAADSAAGLATVVMAAAVSGRRARR
ncbi:hypothetical protein T492DRAFT_1097801, partial [Pavlovales sp. CCMP2436]